MFGNNLVIKDTPRKIDNSKRAVCKMCITVSHGSGTSNLRKLLYQNHQAEYVCAALSIKGTDCNSVDASKMDAEIACVPKFPATSQQAKR